MTLAETMQHACISLDIILRMHYKSPNPALNVMKHNELVYMDATWLDAPTIDHGVTNDHNLIVTLFRLEHQSAVPMIKLGYTSCSSAYSDLGFCCYGEPNSSTNSISVYGLDPVAIAGNCVLGRVHDAFDIAVKDTLFELQTNCTELHIPAFTSFGIPMFRSCDVAKAHLSCALPCIMRNAASINALVELSVSIPSPKLKQMSVRPYEKQPKYMMSVCQSLLLTMCESTIIAQDGRLTSDLFKIINLDSSPHEGSHPASATTSIAPLFAASTDISAHYATVGNCDSVSSMSAVTWELAAVQVYEESKDFK